MVQIEPLIEILMESPEATATNAEFAEWLKEQDELQNKEHEWKDVLTLRDEREAYQSNSNQNENRAESGGTGS